MTSRANLPPAADLPAVSPAQRLIDISKAKLLQARISTREAAEFLAARGYPLNATLALLTR